MSTNTNSNTRPLAAAPPSLSPWTTEKTLWWVAFGVLTLGIVGMLGAWN
ncbi:hypothetical protein GCM10022381_02880 [Leifsonia kafniensis]|uniref:Uncharacterized protein n=1 Tax=Leifsonia kafniensis TaxID=475957 RepID=A0ABP7K0R9_9MICO